MANAPKSVVFVLNDAPYGSERTYNGLRVAMALAKRDGVRVRAFLMGDAVSGAVAGQVTPQGYYNVPSASVGGSARVSVSAAPPRNE